MNSQMPTGMEKLDPRSLPAKACDICGGVNKRFLFKKGGYSIVRCKDCGLVFTDAQISKEQLVSLYGEEFFHADLDTGAGSSLLDYEEQREITVHNLLKKFNIVKHHLPKGGRLLDVGCAHGFFIEAVKDQYDVYGLDISEYAVAYARDVLGLPNAIKGVIEELDFPDEYFNVITMWNTLDHVPNPQTALRHANRLLVKGGVLLLYVEDIGCWMSRLMGRYWFPIFPPFHLTYFDRRSIRRALDRAGFDILTRMKVGVDLRIKDIFNRLQCQWHSRASLFMYNLLKDKAVGNILFNFGSGGNMFVTARKVRPSE